jgi:CBS domain-containing membrane protein
VTDTTSISNADASSTSVANKINRWLNAFRPAQLPVDATERWRSVIGALIGAFLAALLSRLLGGVLSANVWLVAPLGASAVLVFAVPASPLAQPWSVVGGNTVSALAGILSCALINDPVLAGSVAIALAIGLMFQFRCLHPPGGAMALLMVLTHVTQIQFAWFPAFTNSALLVLAGIVYNTLTKRPYPHVQVVKQGLSPGVKSRFSSTDLDVVLARYNQVLDVSRDDLESILQATEMEAYRRQLGEIRCADIMSRDIITVDYATTLEEAWLLMRRHRVKALPVVDKRKRILGIVTMADFMRHANINEHNNIVDRLQTLIRRTTTLHTDKPEVVGQIMTTQVRVASEHRHVVELLPLFSEEGHHHIPIIDPNSCLVGIITQSDLVRALYGATQPST